MWKIPEEIAQSDLIRHNAKMLGIIFIILGSLSLLFPVLGSLSTAMFVAFILFFSGVFTGMYTFQSNKRDWRGWLKAAIFTVVGLYMMFVPLGGVATVGLLFSIYFFADAFSSFTLAMAHGAKHRVMWLLNAALSVVIAMMFVMHWPASSLLFVGIVVGFALLLDGISLLVYVKKERDENETK